ncbi:MAG: BMP family ABC transporter substrate-binding protein [Ruminiclostridium sp.]|nr:BMP family ABC transporter substrate-binding protein [Ruminiclostridium sp.]
MNDMKKMYLTAAVTSLLMISLFVIIHFVKLNMESSRESITVGFVYDGDESTPYTANFIKAQKAVEKKLGDKVTTVVMSNTPDSTGGKNAVASLIDKGCDLIFTTSFGYGDAAKKAAAEHPEIQFCQATCYDANDDPVYSNYHTFMGEIYQGRYIAGVIAGMKLKEMITNGIITPKQAVIGYVAAYPYSEVISGYTAFFLGVRSEVPEATMEVKYTNTWSNYTIEKKCADELIERGCVIISQHSDTTGPAVACEDVYGKKNVYHIGYNQSMIDVAPTTSLISSRINWEPYILGACEAVLANERIEDRISGNVHGNDIGAGFDKGWVEMLELNSIIAAEGSEDAVQRLIDEFKAGKNDVFRGDYIGVDPFDPNNTYDLRNGYIENEKTSAPMFGYVLKDVITVV